jgi:hypothetical protein
VGGAAEGCRGHGAIARREWWESTRPDVPLVLQMDTDMPVEAAEAPKDAVRPPL